jgi:hypothetical protein
MPSLPAPMVTQEVQIVDEHGNVRILLSAKSEVPTIQLTDANKKANALISLDEAGRPSMTLINPDANGPRAIIEIDANGAHVKFDHPHGASSYMFLNNAGGSGVVFIDAKGVRRVDALVHPDGTLSVDRFEGNDWTRA